MTDRAERDGDIPGERAYVRALAAANRERQYPIVHDRQRERADPHRPWLELDLDTPPREIIEPFAAPLEGGKHRRHLLDLAEKALGHGRDRPRRQGRHRLLLRRLASRIK